jgi:hypothetical protein
MLKFGSSAKVELCSFFFVRFDDNDDFDDLGDVVQDKKLGYFLISPKVSPFLS